MSDHFDEMRVAVDPSLAEALRQRLHARMASVSLDDRGGRSHLRLGVIRLEPDQHLVPTEEIYVPITESPISESPTTENRGHRRLALSVAAVVAVIGVAAITINIVNSDNQDQSPGAETTVAQTPTTVAEPTPVAPTATIENQFKYQTKSFNVPFDVTLPAWVRQEIPDAEHPNFVAWDAAANEIDGEARAGLATLTPDLSMYVMNPVEVYPPDSTRPIPSPKDYLALLLSAGQVDHGAHFTDQTTTTVGGRPATIVTATTETDLNGVLGCENANNGSNISGCVGLQAGLVYRIAVIDMGDKTLLVWLQNSKDNHTTEIDSFDKMLTTIQFSDRAVQVPPVTTT